MIHKRGALPVLALLALVVVGAGMQIAFGSAAGSSASPAVSPTATPAPTSGPAATVARSLEAVQRAFNAGDVSLLCRGGRLVDPAVISLQDAGGSGCEAELETLMGNAPPLQLTVRRQTVTGDLASVTLTTAGGQDAVVDLVRRGQTWLLSFSNGRDPMPVLAGTE